MEKKSNEAENDIIKCLDVHITKPGRKSTMKWVKYFPESHRQRYFQLKNHATECLVEKETIPEGEKRGESVIRQVRKGAECSDGNQTSHP